MTDEIRRRLEREVATAAGDPVLRLKLAHEVARAFGPEIAAFEKTLKKLLTVANEKRRLFRVVDLDVAHAVTRRLRHRTHGDLRWIWADGEEYGEKPRIGWKAQGVSYSMGRSGHVSKHKV